MGYLAHMTVGTTLLVHESGLATMVGMANEDAGWVGHHGHEDDYDALSLCRHAGPDTASGQVAAETGRPSDGLACERPEIGKEDETPR